MNRQLSALTDDEWAAMDFDDLAPDMPTQEPTPEQYQAALARLRGDLRASVVVGSDDFDLPDVTVQLIDGTVILEQDGAFMWLSPAMLRTVAMWVVEQQP